MERRKVSVMKTGQMDRNLTDDCSVYNVFECEKTSTENAVGGMVAQWEALSHISRDGGSILASSLSLWSWDDLSMMPGFLQVLRFPHTVHRLAVRLTELPVLYRCVLVCLCPTVD